MRYAPLHDKVKLAFGRLEQLLAAKDLDPRTTAVAWTGGKDSTVALHLWKTFLEQLGGSQHPKALNLDTGYEFPEILAFRDQVTREWRVDLLVAAPDLDAETAAQVTPADKARCCTLRKIEPLKQGLVKHGIKTLITGLRKDEHASRKERPWLEPMPEPPHNRLHIILEFTEMDVWAYTAQHGLPHCELYDDGYRSLGCAPCTRSPQNPEVEEERTGRDPEKERILDQLHSLGYF